jgi:hypothetical protein
MGLLTNASFFSTEGRTRARLAWEVLGWGFAAHTDAPSVVRGLAVHLAHLRFERAEVARDRMVFGRKSYARHCIWKIVEIRG